eukprot:1108697-Rhodomonas_salina.2
MIRGVILVLDRGGHPLARSINRHVSRVLSIRINVSILRRWAPRGAQCSVVRYHGRKERQRGLPLLCLGTFARSLNAVGLNVPLPLNWT